MTNDFRVAQRELVVRMRNAYAEIQVVQTRLDDKRRQRQPIDKSLYEEWGTALQKYLKAHEHYHGFLTKLLLFAV